MPSEWEIRKLYANGRTIDFCLFQIFSARRMRNRRRNDGLGDYLSTDVATHRKDERFDILILFG